VAHPGLINDLKKVDPMTKFGVTSKKTQHVNDIFNSTPITEYQRINAMKSEANYASNKREPLGKSFSRGHVLPQHMQQSDFAFGVKGGGPLSESAKELIYPSKYLNSPDDEAMYKKSHGSIAPGEQKNRDYSWQKAQIDPKKYRFGIKTTVPGAEGMGTSLCLHPELDENVPRSVITTKEVEEMRNAMVDHLGKPRHSGSAPTDLPEDHVFGITFKKENENARDVIQGNYSIEDQQPDRDLGKPVNYGWHNITPEERAFGVPTVRSDIRIPIRRSVADAQNYGDDCSSKELLYPEEFASRGIKDEEFILPRCQKEIREIFETIGYQVTNETFDWIWQDAALNGQYTPNGKVSIAEFRDALNLYLEAKENDTLDKYMQRLRVV
jgi:hypothetical protein